MDSPALFWVDCLAEQRGLKWSGNNPCHYGVRPWHSQNGCN